MKDSYMYESLSLVIPCYNESPALQNMEKSLEIFISENSRRNLFSEIEIIVVNDGSDDGSSDIVNAWSFARVINHSKSKGYGAALKSGFARAQGELIGFLDMDSSYDPLEFFRLAEILGAEKSQIAFGCRFTNQSEMPKVRRIGNRIYVGAVRLLSGTHLNDVCTGQRLFRKSLVPFVTSFKENDLSYSIALSVGLIESGVSISEIRVRYLERDGESKLSVIRDGFGFVFAAIRAKYGKNENYHRRFN